MATERVERRLAAILSADVVGYSRMTAADEEGTLARLRSVREQHIDPKIAEHRGRIVKLMGDGALVEFASVVDAVRCAADVQNAMRELNANVDESQRIVFRIGVNLGDIVIDGDIQGDGVNVAARLEQLAEPGGITISGNAFDQVRDRLELGFEDLGEQQVKNIPRPVRAYRVLLDPAAAGTIVEHAGPKTAQPRRLRWMIAGAAAAVAVIGMVLGVLFTLEPWVPRVEAADPAKMAYALPDKPSIAVMPFENLSGDPEQDYLADGITDTIITALSQSEQLFVIARNSTFAYKGKPAPVKEVAEAFGVGHVLEGSFQKSGEQVRITTRLIDALSGRQVWAGRYDRPMSDIFALQDDITTNIVEELQIELTVGEQGRVARQGTRSPEAYQLLVKARDQFARYSPEGFAKARALSEQAIALDPDYALARVMLGVVLHNEYLNGFAKDPELAHSRSLEEFEKAIAIDDTIASAYAMLSWDHSLRGEHSEAIALGEKATSLEPAGADIANNYSGVLVQAGRPEEAIEWFNRSKRLDANMAAFRFWSLSEAYRQLGRFDEMIPLAKSIVEKNPSYWWEYPRLVYAYMELGQERGTP